MFESDERLYYTPRLTETEEKAWNLYCQESAGMLSAKDFWQELPEWIQLHYIEKVKNAEVC